MRVVGCETAPWKSSIAYEIPDARAKANWRNRKLSRNKEVRGLSSFLLNAALKELGLTKCVRKYGGGGISGRAYSGGAE